MQKLQGQARNLRVGTEVSGSGDQVSSTHVATFQLGQVPVRMEMARAFLLNEGDRVLVAGVRGADGVLAGYAYENLENGARGWAVGPVALIVGLVFGVIGTVALLVVLVSLLGLFGARGLESLGVAAFASIFMLGFGYASLKSLQAYTLTRRALALVKAG